MLRRAVAAVSARWAAQGGATPCPITSQAYTKTVVRRLAEQAAKEGGDKEAGSAGGWFKVRGATAASGAYPCRRHCWPKAWLLGA